MKKTLIPFTIFLAAIAAISCMQEPWEIRPNGADASDTIELGVRCADFPVTRATTPGNNLYNENSIYHLDYFIFAEQPVNGSVAVLHDTIQYASDGIRPVDDPTAAAHARRVKLDKIVGSLPAGSAAGSKKLWLFVVANLPETVVTISPTLTFSQLKALALESSFVQSDAYNLEGYVKPDNRFVMVSEAPTVHELSPDVDPLVIAPLQRIAAKVQVKLNIVEQIQKTVNNIPKTWTPLYQNMQVYMRTAARHGTLGGTPISYEDPGSSPDWFYDVPRYAMFADGTTPGTADGQVNASLISAPVSKQIQEYSHIQLTNTGGELMWDDGTGQPTTTNTSVPFMVWRNVTVTRNFTPVQAVPFYSLPLRWQDKDAHAPCIKIMLPWRDEAGIVTKTYYKLALPAFQYSATESASELRANHCYELQVDLSVLGSTADEVTVDLNGEYHVVNWSAVAGMGSNLNAGRYLSIDKSNYEMYGEELNIPVKSTHELEIINVTSSYTNYSSTTFKTESLTRSFSENTYSGANFYVGSPDRATVLLKHTIQNDLAQAYPRDVATITYTFQVKQIGSTGSELISQLLTVKQYPPIRVQGFPNSDTRPNPTGYAWVNNGYGGYQLLANSSSYSDYRNYYYNYNYYEMFLGGNPAGLGGTGTTNPTMYVLTESVLPPGSTSIIGDPRETAIDNLNAASGRGWRSVAPAIEGGSNRSLTYYYPTNRTASGDNIVAPSLRVASSYGATQALLHADAFRRCATYQEDGYPAGRWRVPTRNEIIFATKLSGRGLIPRLFGSSGTGTTDYWSNSGYVRVQNGGSTTPSAPPEYFPTIPSTTKYVRCVYDEWYWKKADGTPDTVTKTTFTWGDRPR